jgi:DmsE family decaheme c-type cytochrome
LVNDFAKSPHARRANEKDRTCSICHGTQDNHVASGGARSKQVDPISGTQKQVDHFCQSCHHGKHSGFDRSPHGKNGVGCTACHSIHAGSSAKSLLKASQTELCYHCHAEVKPQFEMPSRHNVQNGFVRCTDCHDPHGTEQEESSGAFNRQDTFCRDCHTSMAGPFLFEHAVVKTEGCMACHFPHGGPNPHLLLRANVDAICQSCHFPSPNPKTGVHMDPEKDHAKSSRSCTDCHVDVHGSNRDPIFLAK